MPLAASARTDRSDVSAGRKQGRPRAAFRPVEEKAKSPSSAAPGWAGKKGRQTPKQLSAGTGLCRVCGRRKKLRVNDFMIKMHGSRDDPRQNCGGSETRPAFGTVEP
ncbi:hypothetical protein GCM10023175_22040 [Pseudonocardia xishanensis]|uniref:Uncharacterized protein n=1 Tax=Pseudonocardia xishanensis TaxID=630995 RepID=A0ABP8RPA5_9PSEU